MNDSMSWVLGSRFYEHVKVVDYMNNWNIEGREPKALDAINNLRL